MSGHDQVDTAVESSDGTLPEKEPTIDPVTAESLMESLIEEGLIKPEWRTAIRQFVITYNALDDRLRDQQAILQVTLARLLDNLRDQLDAFSVIASGDHELAEFEDRLKSKINSTEARLAVSRLTGGKGKRVTATGDN